MHWWIWFFGQYMQQMWDCFFQACWLCQYIWSLLGLDEVICTVQTIHTNNINRSYTYTYIRMCVCMYTHADVHNLHGVITLWLGGCCRAYPIPRRLLDISDDVIIHRTWDWGSSSRSSLSETSNGKPPCVWQIDPRNPTVAVFRSCKWTFL